jgi:hypothetical protein
LSLRNSSSDGRRRHLLVAGTGRAGTSALVRYLTGLGLETHLSKNGEASIFDDAAQAGLEDLALRSFNPDLPYVVKSTMFFQIVGWSVNSVVAPKPLVARRGENIPISRFWKAQP